MGLKQMIDKAMQGDDKAIAALPPVKVSGEAHRAYSAEVRKWSGWRDATLVFGDPSPVSPFASCHRFTHVFTVNPERLLLNPNRVLLTVTPFRMRQEAVLTGALLHEAGHARHSHWIPRTEIDAEQFKHSDGSDVTPQEMALAKCAEEPRIEGLMAKDADQIGAAGLGWTMRASAAHLLPMTDLASDPDQALMDLVGSWVLRAGRQKAIEFHTTYQTPSWVANFTHLLAQAIVTHLEGQGQDRTQATVHGTWAIEKLSAMCRGTSLSASSMFEADPASESDTGPFMVDSAKEVLRLLFPETPDSQMPMSGGGCGVGEGEGETSPAAEMDESGEGSGSEPSEADEAGAEGDAAGSGEESSDDQPGEGTAPSAAVSELAAALAQCEAESKSKGIEQAEGDAKAVDSTGGVDGGAGAGSQIQGGWRNPTKTEREIKTGAERFLRDMIEPSVASKVRITDQPSSSVDGAALAAWKAGGQVKAPRFFNQIKRTTKASPPVKIAILVDVSASMDVLQKPSALLSWALAAACLDLRNYAGGGVQIESTLIHWGSTARVVQRNGEILPGIREVGCHDGTTAMGPAIDLIEREIPGFFEIKDQPENKLMVQFTDWKLGSHSLFESTQAVSRALAAGVNMLSVVPRGYSGRHTSLERVLAGSPIQRGRNSLLRYDSDKPEAVWAKAAEALSHA